MSFRYCYLSVCRAHALHNRLKMGKMEEIVQLPSTIITYSNPALKVVFNAHP